MITLSVGGVPEHFNYLWHLPEFHRLLADQGIAIDWTDYPGGTGAMCADLRNGHLDLALLLTEGAVADIAKGNPGQIIGTWVASPLTWGIHASAARPANTLPALNEATYAISRYGSGSHLMAIINCKLRGLPLPARFELVGNLDGARKALASEAADYFMWEKFTTKFLVDAGEFQRVDVCDTPWPCFVLVARNTAVEAHGPELKTALSLLRDMLTANPPLQRVDFIADQFQLDPVDVEAWAEDVRWSAKAALDRAALFKVIDGLLETAVLPSAPAVSSLVAEFVEVG